MARSRLTERVSSTFEAWKLPVKDTLIMMRRTNTLLSGSAALNIVDPSSWMPGDLDFYCPNSEYVFVCKWFIARSYVACELNDGEYQTTTFGPDDFEFEDDWVDVQNNFRFVDHANGCVKTVVRFVHPEHPRTVNVVRSLSDHPAAPVCFFHSTLLMNVVTGSGVTCLYPRAARAQKGAFGRRSSAFIDDHPFVD